MSYSQKQLVDLLNSGKISGETGVPKHIETVISHVFIFDKIVYKFYKNDSEFFNKSFRNLSQNIERFSFTKKDFKWNQTLSPSVYLGLKNIAIKNAEINEVSPEEAEEILMMMNRVDTNDVLYEKLISNKITEEDCFEIGKQLGQNMKKVQMKLPGTYNFYDLFDSRIKDLRDWIKSVTDFISVEESDSYCDYLEDFRQKNKGCFEKELTAEVTTDGDFHSHNAIYSHGQFYLMDTYPPKEAWGIGHKLIGLYRIGIDIWALSGKQKFFEEFIKGYEEGNETKVDRRLDAVYVIYAAGIMVSYLYMLQRTDPDKKESAERFHTFTRDYFAKLK